MNTSHKYAQKEQHLRCKSCYDQQHTGPIWLRVSRLLAGVPSGRVCPAVARITGGRGDAKSRGLWGVLVRGSHRGRITSNPSRASPECCSALHQRTGDIRTGVEVEMHVGRGQIIAAKALFLFVAMTGARAIEAAARGSAFPHRIVKLMSPCVQSRWTQ